MRKGDCVNVHGRGNDECVWGETKATENVCKERALLHEHVRHTNNVSVCGKKCGKIHFCKSARTDPINNFKQSDWLF